ncbi:hypothetical protein D3C72_1617190 [compost metagenome]
MVRFPQLRQARKVVVRVGRDDVGATRRDSLTHGGRHDDTGRLGGGQFLLVFGMAQEAERIGLCILKRREPLDGQRGISMKLAPEGVNDGSELQRHAGSRRYLPAAGAEEPTDALSALITLSVMSCFGLM